jgi:hypothetical protein
MHEFVFVVVTFGGHDQTGQRGPDLLYYVNFSHCVLIFFEFLSLNWRSTGNNSGPIFAPLANWVALLGAPPTQTDRRYPRGICCLRPDLNGLIRTVLDTEMGQPARDALRYPGKEKSVSETC